jgi:hypothetical protein
VSKKVLIFKIKNYLIIRLLMTKKTTLSNIKDFALEDFELSIG